MAEQKQVPSARRAIAVTAAVAGLALLATTGAGCSSAAIAAPGPTTSQRTLTTPPTQPPTPPSSAPPASASTAPAPTTGVVAVTPHDLPPGVSVQRDVAYNEDGRLDVYRPVPPEDASDGGPWPVVVIFGGRSSDKSHYSTVAATVAAGGAVVMVPNYRVTESQPVPLIDARCVVHLAATRADAYGGEPGTVTLAGYAWGATAAVGEAFDGPWKQMATPPSSCSVPADAPVNVRAVVGLVGDYDYYAADDPRAAVYGAYAQVTASPDVPVRLVQGVPDQLAVTPEETSAFASVLEAAGHPVTVADVALPNLALAGLHIDGQAGLSLLDAADRAGVDAAAAEILAAARS